MPGQDHHTQSGKGSWLAYPGRMAICPRMISATAPGTGSAGTTAGTTGIPEHNAFLLRKQTEGQYTRAVRKYLDSQKQQERDRQYREKKLTQNRKKDTLE